MNRLLLHGGPVARRTINGGCLNFSRAGNGGNERGRSACSKLPRIALLAWHVLAFRARPTGRRVIFFFFSPSLFLLSFSFSLIFCFD